MTESNAFYNSVDKKEYVINHSSNCNDRCIIYLLTCNKCKMQHVRKTVYGFRVSWNNFKDNNRKYLREKPCMQHLFEHLYNTYFNTSQARVAMVFWMTPPLSLLIKLIPKILTNGNTTDDIPLKQWHLNVWILRMIDSCSFVLLMYLILFIAMTACIRTNQFGYWLWEWR